MINIVTAFIHEARPLIEKYRLLKSKRKSLYPLYSNEAFTLVISGMGKVAAAAATAYLQAVSRQNASSVWLNIGIAGHRDFKIGKGFIAHKITDQASGRSYYPPLIHPFSCASSALVTVDQPEKIYPVACGYDMEASGFYQIALRAATIEWVYCYKVVSDNSDQPAENVTKEKASLLISERLDEIEGIFSLLCAAIKQKQALEGTNEEVDEILKRWHFTETQKAQLIKGLRRWKTLYGKAASEQIRLASHSNSKSFLEDLQQQLAAHSLEY